MVGVGALAAGASLGGCILSRNNELNVYNWSDYIGETTIQDFEAEFRVKVNYDNYSSNDELLAKMTSGATGYDVIVPNGYIVEILKDQDLLEPLDMDRIDNFRNVAEKFRSPPYDPGLPEAERKFSVPYLWGTTGMGFNQAKVGEEVKSWGILWDDNYKAKITMLRDIRHLFSAAFKYLGYSVNSTDPDQLEQAKQKLLEQKALVSAYTNDTYMNMLATGDAWLCQGWSGDVCQVRADNQDVKYVIPEEGSDMYLDSLVIPKGAPHIDLAHEFINFTLRPEISANISNYVWYPNANEASHRYLDPQMLNDPAIYPPSEIMAKLEFLVPLGEYEQQISQAWLEIIS